MLTAQEIIEQTARKYGLTVPQIVGKQRARPIIQARWEAIWRCSRETPLSIPEIGRAFGNRMHGVIKAAIQHHERDLAAK